MKIGTFINHGTLIEIESVQTMNLHVDKGELHFGDRESLANEEPRMKNEEFSSSFPPCVIQSGGEDEAKNLDDTAQPSTSGCTQILRRSAPLDDTGRGTDDTGRGTDDTGRGTDGAREGTDAQTEGTDDTVRSAEATGIKVQPAVVLMLMREMQPLFTQKVDWLSPYSVLLRRRWVDGNLRAWCRLVDTRFGVQLDPRTLSADLRNLGSPDYTRWTDADKRIARRKRLAADFDTRLTQYFERKREEVLTSLSTSRP